MKIKIVTIQQYQEFSRVIKLDKPTFEIERFKYVGDKYEIYVKHSQYLEDYLKKHLIGSIIEEF